MKTIIEIAGLIAVFAVAPCVLLVLSWLQWRKATASPRVLLAANCILSTTLFAWLLTGFIGEWGSFEPQRGAAWLWVPPAGIFLSLVSLILCCIAKRALRLYASYASFLFLTTNVLAFYSNGV